jgi:hypothetical protein
MTRGPYDLTELAEMSNRQGELAARVRSQEELDAWSAVLDARDRQQDRREARLDAMRLALWLIAGCVGALACWLMGAGNGLMNRRLWP